MAMTSFAVAATRRAPLRGCLAAARSAVGGGSSATFSRGIPISSHRAHPRVAPSTRRFAVAADGASPTSAGGQRKHRVVFLGTPDVAASALDALLDAADEPDCAWEVHAVVSQPGRPRGRGRSKSGPPPPSPVAECALRRGVPEDRVLCPVKANEPEFLEALARMEPDLAVTAASVTFSRQVSRHPAAGHAQHPPQPAAPVPRRRARAARARARRAGPGVSVAYTVLEMDAGPVVRRVERPLDGSEKHVDLLRELFATGAEALLEALPSVWTGEAATLATPQAAFGEPTHAPKVSPEEGVLDFKNETATTLRDKVRGFDGWPGTKGAFLVKKEDAAEDAWQEVTLKIVTAAVFEDASETTAAVTTPEP